MDEIEQVLGVVLPIVLIDLAHDRMHIHERGYGTFERSFVLPKNVDAGKIRADFHDGLIEIHMPKGEKSKSKHIEIKVK